MQQGLKLAMQDHLLAVRFPTNLSFVEVKTLGQRESLTAPMENEFFSVEPQRSRRPAWQYRAALALAILVGFIVIGSLVEPDAQLSGNYTGYLGTEMSDDKIGFTLHLEHIGHNVTGSGRLSWIYGGKQLENKVSLSGRVSGTHFKLSGPGGDDVIYLDGYATHGESKDDYTLKLSGRCTLKGGSKARRQPGGFILKKLR